MPETTRLERLKMFRHIVDDVADETLFCGDTFGSTLIWCDFQLHASLREVRCGSAIGGVAEPALFYDGPDSPLTCLETACRIDFFDFFPDSFLCTFEDLAGVS